MDYNLIYHHNCNVEEFCDECDIDPEDHGNSEWLTIDEWDGKFKVWAENNAPHIIAHECLHVVIKIARRMNIILWEDSEEFFCYTTDYFIKEILNKLKKYDKPSRRALKLVTWKVPISTWESWWETRH